MNIPGVIEGTKLVKITYLKEDNYYMLKNLEENSRLYIKIDKRTNLKQGTVILFRDYQLFVNYKLAKEFNSMRKIIIQVLQNGKNIGY